MPGRATRRVFSCVRGKMERTGVPVLFFIVPAWFFIVIETWRDRSASALSPFRGLFARPRPPRSLLIPCYLPRAKKCRCDGHFLAFGSRDHSPIKRRALDGFE
jgi:hypothetical protein